MHFFPSLSYPFPSLFSFPSFSYFTSPITFPLTQACRWWWSLTLNSPTVDEERGAADHVHPSTTATPHHQRQLPHRDATTPEHNRGDTTATLITTISVTSSPPHCQYTMSPISTPPSRWCWWCCVSVSVSPLKESIITDATPRSNINTKATPHTRNTNN